MSVGVVLKPTDRSVPQGSDNTGVAQLEHDDFVEQDEGAEDEPVRILEEQASFDEVVLWGHESTPDENDPYVKGIQEWIAFAETVCCVIL
jgi:ribonuclease H2 subunit C